MSTLSCQLLVCSSAITEDLYKAFLRKAPASKRAGMGRASDGAGGSADNAPLRGESHNRAGLVSYARLDSARHLDLLSCFL